MKTKLFLSCLFMAVALIAAFTVMPAYVAAGAFAFFMSASVTCASFALRSDNSEIKDALDGDKGEDK